MEAARPVQNTVRFGAFEVNLRPGELRKQGARIKLQEQPFHVLQMLLEQPGEIVTREELQKRIWPGKLAQEEINMLSAIRLAPKA